MVQSPWRPTADLGALRARDSLYKQIRAFFSQHNFLEVDVPLLAKAGSTDPHLHSITSQVNGKPAYLQTSPEFFMKRLLAAGSGPIFALTKAFREGEAGRLHNPEFTILEWYQPGFNDQQLMDQVAALLHSVLETGVPQQRLSYRDTFLNQFGFDPHSATLEQLKQEAQKRFDIEWDDDNPNTWLEFLFSHGIQPTMSEGITFVYDYPAPQAALAKIMADTTGVKVAKRFEVFINGLEIGNGYWELTDAEEQAVRFQADLTQRTAMGLPAVTADNNLICALREGMPEAAGIALGVDRLLMVTTKATSIDQVLAFPVDRI